MTADAVKNKLLSLASPERAELVARYFQNGPGQYAEGDLFMGMSMPQQREVARQFSQLPIEETQRLVHDEFHECRMVGL